MGKLVVTAQMTMDGVIDSIDQWFLAEGEHENTSLDHLRAAEALLLGRKTYEGLAAYWSPLSDDGGFAELVNRLPKFVATRTLTEPLTWNATAIVGDVMDGVAALKLELRGDLLMYGCGELAGQLAHRGLVDEVCLFVHPVAFGDGTQIFGAAAPVRLTLLAATTFRSGVVLLTYRPTTG
jgi:dihydrofolate reductase